MRHLGATAERFGACVHTKGHPQFRQCIADQPGNLPFSPGPHSFRITASETSATIALLRKPAAQQNVVNNLAKRYYVSGAVQGVGYRFFVENVANRLGVAGYVKNLNDGRVEVYAIGQEPQLDALKSELKRGPRVAGVKDVAEVDASILPEYTNDFRIERDY